MTFTNADAESLAEKLRSADLTQGECAVLAHLLAALDDEVSGFDAKGFWETEFPTRGFIGDELFLVVSKLQPPTFNDAKGYGVKPTT